MIDHLDHLVEWRVLRTGATGQIRSIYFRDPDLNLSNRRARPLNTVRPTPDYSIALTMSSTTFFASPNTIIVLSM